ncbi:MAG: polyprenyl synthetase family protein [Actinomycetota bacterium]
MIDSARFTSLVDERLVRVVRRERDHYGHLDGHVEWVLDEINRLVTAGGKRVRPELAHLGWIAAGGEPCAQTAVNIGAALELLHVSALVHDDVIDGAATRRGAYTTHVRVARDHREKGWSGEERRISEGAAVLAGNITLAIADAALGEVNAAARKQWTRVRIEVNLGQYMDLLGAASRAAEPDRIWRVMAMKTAKYTVERPLRMGAAAAGTGNEWIVGTLGSFGEMLGIAFQLRDDVLGVFGHREVTGKPVGDDLREGKTTMLVAHALERADARQRKVLDRIGDPSLTPEDVTRIQQVIIDTHALQSVEGDIDGFRSKALGMVEHADLPHGVFAELAAIADRMTRRDY